MSASRYPHYVVMSGMPASGKTTLGRAIAESFQVPMLDKDDYLAALFEACGTGDERWRTKLSRDSDLDLQRAALQVERAVLCSFWRHPSSSEQHSGTAIEWLTQSGASLTEVYCSCSLETALTRFRERRRHPGHLDERRQTDALREQFDMVRQHGPLGIGQLVEVDTERGVDMSRLYDTLAAHGFDAVAGATASASR